MSLPIEYARELARSIQSGPIANLIAQAKAKQILREVRESPANFPQFTPDLDERVTFAAYSLLAAGCSLVERTDQADGYGYIQAAADLLESAHKTEAHNDRGSSFHCLVGSLAFYASGQYSRAFVLIRSVQSFTPAAALLGSFLRKDSNGLVEQLNGILLEPEPQLDEMVNADEWPLNLAFAQAIAFIFEHSFSGEAKLLEQATSVLNDAMIIAESGSHPAFWWLARLLKLILGDHGRSTLWNILPPYFDPDGASQVENYVRLLALSKPPVCELWESQRAALSVALGNENNGGVVNLRTSAGKTRVAELAILRTLRKDPGAKVLYLAPFRSLAFELERSFSKFLAPLGYSVSHLYGGSRFSSVDRELAIEGNITIATPEKAKAMLRAAPELFENVKLVVIDEGHLLGANERNVRNELFLEHLRLLSRHRQVRMLLLSAVLPNARELASWIGGAPSALAQSNWKPSGERFGILRWNRSAVKIEWKGKHQCFNPHFVEFTTVPKGKKGTRQFPENKLEAVAATAVRLATLGPVLIFAGQAKWVDSMARKVLLALGPNPTPVTWPETEWKVFESVCKEELGPDAIELVAARLGVICHSKKLPPQVRIAVEKLMAKQAARIIVATTTLGQGVNIGISSVIVATPYIGHNLTIDKRDFWNICGRAGRAFVDAEGKILFAIDATREPWQVRRDELMAKQYFDITQMDTVESGLLLVIRTLRAIASQVGISFEVLLELIANNGLERCGAKRKDLEDGLDIIDDQLLALHVAYKGTEDLSAAADWIDDAFRESLAAIQEKRRVEQGEEAVLLRFVKARVSGILAKVSSSAARRAVVSSGLPLSIAIKAFEQLQYFRGLLDTYIESDSNLQRLNDLVAGFETWARANAMSVTEDIPEQATLDVIRPLWLSGMALRDIVELAGDVASEACANFYGYQLPWLFHAVAQKLDKNTEENRIDALSDAGLLVEIGLPSEAAAKVFLAGIRSREAATELGQYVTNTSASVSRIRKALLNPETVAALSANVSMTTLEWLHLLTAEHGASEESPVSCSAFTLKNEVECDVLHARRHKDQVWLCSVDGKIKFTVAPTEDLPFDKLANDPRHVFVLRENAWHHECRDPSVANSPDFSSLFGGF